MTKIFYDDLIKIEEIFFEFEDCDFTSEEKEEFISLIDETFHHHMLDLILDNLPEEYHEFFLSQFYQTPCNKGLMKFLKEKIDDDIDRKIEKRAQEIKKEILAEIKKSAKR